MDYDENQYSGQSQQKQPISMMDDPIGGENVKVAVRIRPLLPFEFNRGDESCVKVLDEKNLQIHNK